MNSCAPPRRRAYEPAIQPADFGFSLLPWVGGDRWCGILGGVLWTRSNPAAPAPEVLTAYAGPLRRTGNEALIRSDHHRRHVLSG